MTTSSIRFRCQQCQACIKAPVQLIGLRRACPGCGHIFIVGRQKPRDAEPVLVTLDAGRAGPLAGWLTSDGRSARAG
jgi:hypothetical protein